MQKQTSTTYKTILERLQKKAGDKLEKKLTPLFTLFRHNNEVSKMVKFLELLTEINTKVTPPNGINDPIITKVVSNREKMNGLCAQLKKDLKHKISSSRPLPPDIQAIFDKWSTHHLRTAHIDEIHAQLKKHSILYIDYSIPFKDYFGVMYEVQEDFAKKTKSIQKSFKDFKSHSGSIHRYSQFQNIILDRLAAVDNIISDFHIRRKKWAKIAMGVGQDFTGPF